jgi:hypothetical protein
MVCHFKQSATIIYFQFIQVVILVVIKAVTILPQKLDIFVDHLGYFNFFLPIPEHISSSPVFNGFKLTNFKFLCSILWTVVWFFFLVIILDDQQKYQVFVAKLSQLLETIKNWGRTNVFRNGEKEIKIPISITMSMKDEMKGPN